MKVIVIAEHGYEEAKYGFSLSFKDRTIPPSDWWTDERSEHYDGVVSANAGRDGGHNKFLEHIMVWIDIEATLEWWKQFDTYRIGVSKQSESTMHTLDRRKLVSSDFEGNPTHTEFLNYLKYLNDLPSREKSERLPQAYLQRRQVVTNYKTLRHIFLQRGGHRLGHWGFFMSQVLLQIQHPVLIIGQKEANSAKPHL